MICEQAEKSKSLVQSGPGAFRVERCSDGRRRLLRKLRVDVEADSAKTDIVRVPKGFVTDYSSLPWGTRWLVHWSRVDVAGVVHDYLYRCGKDVPDSYTNAEADAIWRRVAVFGDRRAYCHQALLGWIGLRLFGWWSFRRLDEWAYTDRPTSSRHCARKWTTRRARMLVPVAVALGVPSLVGVLMPLFRAICKWTVESCSAPSFPLRLLFLLLLLFVLVLLWTLPGERNVKVQRNDSQRPRPPLLTLLAFLLAQPLPAKSGTAQEAGQRFRDCPTCPEMVVVPAGTFIMGSPESEDDRLRFVIDEAGAVVHWLVEALKTADGGELGHGSEWEGHRVIEPEGPQRYVTFASPFAVSIAEITFAEWDACARAGGCGGLIPDNEGWGRGSRPVINVSWEDAIAYVEWLSDVTGEQYGLPSEAQWEYAARAGTETARFWGQDPADQCLYANGADAAGLWKYPDWIALQCSDGYPETAPVRSFEPNPFGLHDMLGNVSEWTRDCWNERYAGGPVDGTAWESGDCSRRLTRGGSWINHPGNLRAANRYPFAVDERNRTIGFRVARVGGPAMSRSDSCRVVQLPSGLARRRAARVGTPPHPPHPHPNHHPRCSVRDWDDIPGFRTCLETWARRVGPNGSSTTPHHRRPTPPSSGATPLSRTVSPGGPADPE